MKTQFFGQNPTGWSLDSRYRYQDSKDCKFPNKTEESIAGAGFVTASVNTPRKKPGCLFFPLSIIWKEK